jgi:hypothetical protein
MGKGTRLPLPSTDIRVKSPLARIHCDIWGPARQKLLGGSAYFHTIVDNLSRYCKITPLCNKSQAFDASKAYIAHQETRLDKQVKEVRTDGGAEFKSNAAQQYYFNKGITHSEAHAQNRRVERPHLTILNTVRTLLSQVPQSFWAEAALYAVYTRNCLPRSDMTVPIARFTNQPTEYRRFDPFGAQCWSIDHTNISKLDNWYKKGQFLRYNFENSNLRIWDTKLHRSVTTGDLAFSKGFKAQDTAIRVALITNAKANGQIGHFA